MNQMMGTAATSMATMLGTETDISTPEVNRIDVESVKLFEKMFDSEQDLFLKIAFRLEVGDDLTDSTMVQLYPISVAKQMVKLFQINKKED
jgi:flagellar motor switch protein FliN/FliY